MKVRIETADLPRGLFDGMYKSEMYLKKTPLDHKLLELVKYRISQINGCAFCLDMHHKEALLLGETELRLHSVIAWRECPYYSEQERAALAFAEALTNANMFPFDDSCVNRLFEFFSPDEVAQLTLAVTQINAWNRINRAFGTEPGKYQPGQFS